MKINDLNGHAETRLIQNLEIMEEGLEVAEKVCNVRENIDAMLADSEMMFPFWSRFSSDGYRLGVERNPEKKRRWQVMVRSVHNVNGPTEPMTKQDFRTKLDFLYHVQEFLDDLITHNQKAVEEVRQGLAPIPLELTRTPQWQKVKRRILT